MTVLFKICQRLVGSFNFKQFKSSFSITSTTCIKSEYVFDVQALSNCAKIVFKFKSLSNLGMAIGRAAV